MVYSDAVLRPKATLCPIAPLLECKLHLLHCSKKSERTFDFIYYTGIKCMFCAYFDRDHFLISLHAEVPLLNIWLNISSSLLELYM